MIVRRLGFMLLVAACHRQAAPLPTPQVPVPSLPTESPFTATLAAVRSAADSGRFTVADSILTAFEQEEGASAESKESAFWRAMLRADPRNPAFSAAAARVALESYLTTPDPAHEMEARVMLRMLAMSDSLRAAMAAQKAAADTRERAREEELQKLREEMQRVQAELDRIKRRLGTPKP